MKATQPTLHVLHTESVFNRGGEKYLYELLRRAARVYPVHLYLYTLSPKWRRQYKRENVSVTIVWKPSRIFWLLLPITLLVNYLQLRKRIQPTDLVFATNFPMNLLAVSLSRRSICHCAEPLPIFYDSVRIAALPFFPGLCVRMAKLTYAPLDRFAYNHCAVLTTLNHSVERFVRNVYKRKPDVLLPNGIDSKLFTPGRHSLKRTALIIGHSTDYTVFKGTKDFLAILHSLHASGIPFRAEISESLADPDTKRVYDAYLHEHNMTGLVTFVGTLSERQLVAFYRSLDVFVFTGSPEGSGAASASLSVLEAQSCGIPVIRSIGNTDEIQEGKTGFYINPHEHEGSGAVLRQFFRLSPPTRARMGNDARQYVAAHFNWEVTSQIFIKTIRALQTSRSHR